MREGVPVPKARPQLPKILLWDTEWAKMIVRYMTYDLKQYSNWINPDYIERDTWCVCVAWKWLGENTVWSVSVLNDPERFENNYADDYHVIKTIHALMEEADIIVAHNGDKFDWPKFVSRCIYHRLPPPKKPKFVDTLKIARKEAKFSSNALRYLNRHLGIRDKDEAPDWDKVSTGDVDEIVLCTRYCRGDVKSLEEYYLVIRPYATNHPNLNLFLTGQHHQACPTCNSPNLQRRGYNVCLSRKYQRYQCQSCGKYCDERHIGGSPENR